jgi:hypothetical protein
LAAPFNPKTYYSVDPNTYDDTVNRFRSDHVGGVQFVLCDGSVRFINQNIDQSVLSALGTRAGGDVVGDF